MVNHANGITTTWGSYCSASLEQPRQSQKLIALKVPYTPIAALLLQ